MTADQLLLIALALQLAGIGIAGFDVRSKVKRYRATPKPDIRTRPPAGEAIRRGQEVAAMLGGYGDGDGHYVAMDGIRARADKQASDSAWQAQRLHDLIEGGYRWILIGLGLTAAGTVLATVAGLIG